MTGVQNSTASRGILVANVKWQGRIYACVYNVPVAASVALAKRGKIRNQIQVGAETLEHRMRQTFSLDVIRPIRALDRIRPHLEYLVLVKGKTRRKS